VADDGVIRVEERNTSIAQFERITVDVTGLEDWRDLASDLSASLRQAREAVSVDHLVTRLQVTGGTPLAWRIRRDLDLLKTEVDERASVIGGCWVEKLEVACHVPTVTNGDGLDPVTELRHLIDSKVCQSDSFRQAAIDIAEELRTQLPPDCRTLLGTDESAFLEVLAELASEGADDVIARLHAIEGEGES